MTAAHAAQRQWRELPLARRIELVGKGIDNLVGARDAHAEQLCWQMGRPIGQADGEFAGVLERSNFMLHAAEDCLRASPIRRDGLHLEIRRQPLGVVFAVVPWNYPYLTAVNTLVPALVAGNAVLLKPSPQTPLCGEHFADAFLEAGLPFGTLQCLHMDPEHVLQLVRIGNIDHVAFTGSTNNGALVERAAAGRFMSVGLELGGKDAAYVMPDADLDFACEELASGAFFNAGQSCCAVERIYVAQDRYADFLDMFADKCRSYVPGNPLDGDTRLGPVVSHAAARRIQGDVDDALRQGATRLFEPLPPQDAGNGDAYLSPQVLLNVNHGMRIMEEETFGPVVGVMAVADDAQAIRLINNSRYGLTASLWTRDVEAASALSSQIDTGTVFINRCDVLEPSLPWSGVKHSGRGCTLSKFGFDALTRPKSLNIRHPDDAVPSC